MVAFSDCTSKQIPPPPAGANVGAYLVEHIHKLPEFAHCTALVAGGPRSQAQLSKGRAYAVAVAARLPPLEGYGTDWVLRLAHAVAVVVVAWHVLAAKGEPVETPVKKNAPAPVPAAAHSVSAPSGRRARKPLVSGPYDSAKRPAKRGRNSSEVDAVAELLARSSLEEVHAVPEPEPTADGIEELCGTLGKTHIAPPVPAAPVPATPALFAVPVFATVPAPAPAAVPVTMPPPSAPRRATVDLPEVDTAPVFHAPAVAPEPLIYIPCVRKTRARAPTRSPYSKAARKPVKLAPPPVLECDAEVPYIEAVTETFSGEHLFTEVHVLDARPLRDGRLARRESRGWRRIAVA